MIDPGSQFFCLSGDIPIGGPTTLYVIVWDQRRVVSVTVDGEEEDDNVAIGHLRNHIDHLSSDVHRIYVSSSGDIISEYKDADNDRTYCVHYPHLSEANLPDGIQTVRRDELEELDRLGPDVDLVRYPASASSSGKTVAFKYYFMWQYADKSWKEMNLWMRLPRHPNIVPFDRVVLDEIEGRVVGFTNDYVTGETLEKNKSRVFKLKWLQQLTQVVDTLNLRCGIAHQDVAPRNLLVDDSTDSIMIFDFNFASRIDPSTRDFMEGYMEDRNDVKGVIFTVYEIVTRDSSLRSIPHEEQRLDDLGGEWKQHPEVELDRPLADYRALLHEWRQQRMAAGASDSSINWPPRPSPPIETTHGIAANGQPYSTSAEAWYRWRRDLQKTGESVLSWERPPQASLRPGCRLLSTGRFIEE